ncbi:bile acid:sodium symporter family protein [Mesorhizobium microcysteis]|uniref:Bile acid:sodium symporter family protein n=1 Tax=Neoaquamicrobium microcysteis TaxID=2682781 RepID=A0A5D4GZ85_9HYPH|nr:bile acid:sodium symporter family protein [Mesorhizobium microcysteis]TYR33698.1 bile acid:sodium symporter family protein [Mesorhizobium microcysteis]
MPLDDVTLNFNPSGLMLLNAVLAIVMFGVALDLSVADFRRVAKAPRALALGFASQFVFLPAATLLLVIVTAPPPSIALGLILVAACPGGNISNFLTHRAEGNTALSVSLTAISTVAAVFMTPFSLAFWAGLHAPAAELVRETNVSVLDMGFTVGVLLVLPLGAGMAINARVPRVAARMRGPMRIVSLLVFAGFVAGALAANWAIFIAYVGMVFVLVLVHNAVALAGGYVIAAGGGLAEADRRAISIETGIQNSGLGLVLIFNFFGGLGGMAIVAAWWGVWHIVSGLAVAELFRRRNKAELAATV